MPRAKQRGLSFRGYLIDYLGEYFEANKEELAKTGVTSVNGLAVRWIEDELRAKGIIPIKP